MSDFKFSCSGCGQHIQCDENFSGSSIQCPSCQIQITIPSAPSRFVRPSPKDLPPPPPLREPSFSKPVRHSTVVKEYNGIGRLAYVGILFGLQIAFKFAAVPIIQKSMSEAILDLCLILYLGVLFAATSLRLQNIGHNGWLSVLLIVPIANLVIVFRCYVYPPGYFQTKQLDTAARIMIGVFFVSILIAAWFIASVLASI